MLTKDTGRDFRRIQAESESSLPKRFERVVALHGSRPVFGAGAWQPTYGELNAAANRVAHVLLDRGGNPGDRIALLIEHEAAMLAAMLAALKAGKIVVPLNPADPPARVRQIVEDSQAALIVSDAANRKLAVDIAPASASLVSFEDHRADERVHNPEVPFSPLQPALLVYTSGSTGRPKAVMPTHRYVLDHIRRGYSEVMRFLPEDRVVLLSPLSGLLGISTAWGALLSGAVLFPFPAAQKGVTGFADWLIGKGITIFISSTSLFRHFMRTLDEDVTFPQVRAVRVTSEPANSDDFKAYCRHFTDLSVFVHGLSASEAGNVANLRLTRADIVSEGRLPVGHVADGIEVALVGEHGQQVGRGETGEIVVRSRYLPAGYWRDDALTAEKFSDWTEPWGFQTLRSGDLGRFNSKGLLELVGRKDGRVKIRGFRIELAEVEEALLQHPDVENAAVCAVDRPKRGAQLVAYVVPRPGHPCTAAELRRAMRGALPEYMVPSAFFPIDRIPQTAQAKVDRGMLLKLHPPVQTLGRGDETKTKIEVLLAGLWEEAFNIEGVGRQDDFFELGGDSLIAAVIAAGVHAAAGVELNLGKFADHTTVAELARAIDDMRDTATSRNLRPLVRVSRDNPLPLSPNQERIWKFCQSPELAAKYTMTRRYLITGPLDIGILRECIGYLFKRHEILRTTFSTVNKRPVQVIHPPSPAPLTLLDLSGVADAEDEASRLFDKDGTPIVDLTQLPLTRFLLVRIRENVHWMNRVDHHILSDIWSRNVFFHELGLLYEARLAGEPPPLPEFEPVQFCDYAAWRREAIADQTAYRDTLAWWKNLFSEPVRPVELSFRRAKPRSGLTPGEGIISWGLGRGISRRLGELGRKEGATFFTVRLAVFVALLAAETGDPNVVVGTYVTNRSRVELQKMLGYFSDLTLLRFRFEPNRSFRDWLSIVRKRLVDTEAHCDLPYELLREGLLGERVTLPEVRVIFQKSDVDPPGQFGGLRVTLLDQPRRTMPWGFTMLVKEHHDDDQEAQFDAELYDPAGVRVLIERFRRLFDAVSRYPALPVRELLAMSESRSASRT